MKSGARILGTIKRGMTQGRRVVVECEGAWFEVCHLYFKNGLPLVGTGEGVILRGDKLTDAKTA